MYYSLINSMSKGGVIWDTDALAFISAAAITDATQKSAINTLVKDLKGYSIWTKMKALYPMVGGTATTHKFNLKDPRDLDAAYRLVFNGGWTHSTNGALPNGTTGYADTNLNDNVLTLNNAHVSTYLKTDNDGLYCDIGAIYVVSGRNQETNIFARYGNTFYPRMQDTNNGIGSQTTSLGLFVSNRVNSTQIRASHNGVLKTLSSNTTGKAGRNIFISAANFSTTNTANYYSNRQTAFSSIGDGLTDTEATNFYTAVQAYQTTLGRQI
jgi:hypothetical protein